MAAVMREQEVGAHQGAGFDWGAKVGKLTVYQMQRVLHAVEAVKALAAQAPTGVSTQDDMLAVLSATGGYAALVDDVVHAAAAVANIGADVFYDLPLDEAIDAVRQIAVAALDRNAEYIAGPVTAALQRVADVAQAFRPGAPSA